MTGYAVPDQRAVGGKQGLGVSLVALDVAVHAPLDMLDSWRMRVLGALDEVRAALARHVEFTEGPEGLFAEVIDYAPRLVHAVKNLYSEHEDLGRRINTCEEKVREIAIGDSIEDLESRTAGLAARFDRHRDRGAELVYDAYNIEISEAD